MFSKRVGAATATAALALVLSATPLRAQTAPAPAPATAPVEKPGSLHLQCDGEPPNVTTGESAARLLGAVTLLGLFAPPPEAPDAGKRKFGAAGVEICSLMISGPKQEGNIPRRLHLILARAIHQIEAKNYDAAMADTALARQEAAAAGLATDPYFARSFGRAPDLIDAAALYRKGKPEQARDIAVKSVAQLSHSLFGLLSPPGYTLSARSGSDDEQRFYGWRSHSAATFAGGEAQRLEEIGRFADAAHVRDALVEFDRVSTPASISSIWLAQAAVSHALAGDKTIAEDRAHAAQANFDQRKADGKAEANAAEFVELMDLYNIIATANNGDVKAARRLFAARSQWVAASFGSVVEVTRRLRAGATGDELIGGLSRTPEQLWTDREATLRAATLGKDSDNKTLFWLIPRLRPAAEYEALSKRVWRTDKSNILITPSKPRTDGNKLETLFLYGTDAQIAMEAYTLHAALLARARGHQGFVIVPIITDKLVAAAFMSGNRGDPGMPDALFNDTATVIADLSTIIPDPAVLKARRAAR